MSGAIGEESAHDILNLLPSRKSRGSGPVPRKTQRLDRSWRELEKRLAQIPLDKTGRTLQDEDEGHISAQLLATVDPPFDYDLKRFYNNDEFPDWISKHQTVQSSVESLQALFAKWFQAAPEFDLEHEYWSKVPAMLRFAFKRPLMPDKALDHRLREMGLSWSSSYVAWMRRKSKAPSGRKQARLYGIDLEPVDSRRLRARYNNVLGTDWSEDVVSGSNGVRTQDRRYEEKLKSALLKAYATFRKGAFSTDQAIDWYKSLLKMPDISHHDLARRLEGIGIPRVHILGEETTTDEASLPALLQNTCDALKEGHISYETAITHYRSLLDMPEVPLAQVATRLEEFGLPRAHLFGEVSKEASSSLEAPSPSKDESDIMEELENHVKAYRSGFYNLEEAVSFVSARLEGMSVDRPLFSTLISSSDLSPARAAEVIFERAAEESPRSTPSPETNPDNNKEDLKKIAQHFIEEYVESIKGGLDPGIALAEYRDKYGLDDFSSSEVLSIFKQLGIPVDNLPAVGDARATTDTDVVDDLGGPLDSSMPSPKVPMSRERSPNPDSETTAQSDTSSVASGTTLCDSTHSDLPESAVSDWEHCFEGTAGNPNGSDYDLINSSPEQGFSTDLWGLEMPTGQAKKLGEDIGLPAKYVHRRIRSHTPHRKAVTRLRKSSMSLKSLPAKRKASATVHQGRRTRFPKDALGVDVSAEEGNNRDTVGQGESVAGVSLDCAAEQPVLDSPSSCDVTKQSMHNLVKDEALLLEGDIQTGRIGRLTFEAVEIDQFTAVGSGASPDGSDTILEILESDIIQDGILRTDLPLDSESYKDHIRSNASWMKSDIAAKISISQVRPISNDIERRLIVLLCALGRDPSWANVHKLITSVRQGLKEHADAKSATRTIEASIHAGNPKPLFPRPPSVPANNKSQAECSSEANGMLSSSVKIGKRHQRLRLTQPRKPRKPTHNTPGAPFLGTPKDISSIAAENRESFFVCIQRMRRQRPKANHYALENRYFQNPTSLPSSSGSASHLNKLFDKYRGNTTNT